MAGFSDYLENEILDHIFGIGSYTAPSIYVALYTAAPSDSGGGTEVSGNNYSRVSHSGWATASGGATSNSSIITFPTPSGTWGTVTHFGLFDASTSGNLLGWGALSASKAPTSGDTVSFAIGALDVTLD